MQLVECVYTQKYMYMNNHVHGVLQTHTLQAHATHNTQWLYVHVAVKIHVCIYMYKLTRIAETRLTSNMVGNTLNTRADSTKLIPLQTEVHIHAHVAVVHVQCITNDTPQYKQDQV